MFRTQKSVLEIITGVGNVRNKLGINHRRKLFPRMSTVGLPNCSITNKGDFLGAKNETSAVAGGSFGLHRELGLSLDDYKGQANNMQMDTSKSEKLRNCVEQSVNEDSRKKIFDILQDVDQLSDVEKLLLYLKLPTGVSVEDPLKQKNPSNPLGKKADAEVSQTVTWIQSHLEEDPDVSLPKQEVYDEYSRFCQANKIEVLCAADFGKVMKHVYPSVKPRRLGTRGNSRYCYSGLKKRLTVESPTLPDLKKVSCSLQDKLLPENAIMGNASASEEVNSASSYLIFEWAEKLLSKNFTKLNDLAYYLLENTLVDNRSVAAFTLLSSPLNTHGIGRSVCSGPGNLAKETSGIAVNKSSSNFTKRKETQLQLQRKLAEKGLIKEQKQKMQEQQNTTSKNCKVQRRNCKKDSAQQSTSKSKDNLSKMSNISVHNKTKTDKTEDSKDVVLTASPPRLFRCRSENGINAKSDAKPVPIMHKSTSPVVSVSQGTVSSIIIIPTHVQISPSDVGSVSPTKLTSQQKYKRIQPKPTNCAMLKLLSTRQSPVQTSDNLASELTPVTNSIGIRQIAQSIRTESNTLPRPSSGVQNIGRSLSKDDTEDVCSPPQLHFKRQAQDHEPSGVAKKLHLDNVPTSTAQSSFVGYSNFGIFNNTKDDQNEMSINDLESDALLEFLQGGSRSNNVVENQTAIERKDSEKPCTKLSQLRLLLERNLPQNTASKLLGNIKKQLQPINKGQVFRSRSEPRSDRSLWLPNTTSVTSLTSDNCNSSDNKMFENTLSVDSSISNLPSQPTDDLTRFSFCEDELLKGPSERLQNFPSVPPSPNTRRRAFDFMPISPGQTPNPLENHLITSPIPPQFLTNNPLLSSTIGMNSIAVGPSQPPSTASSPFVSPRGTPVPLVRSRHSSGQSIHRQTPYQATDSGVSSISTSPFVSPQTTPVPISRLRHNSNHSGKSVTFSTHGPQVNVSTDCRSRHSSGPLTSIVPLNQGYLSESIVPLGDIHMQRSFTETSSIQNSAFCLPSPSPQSNSLPPLTVISDNTCVDPELIYSLKQSPHVQWSSGTWSNARSRHMSCSVIDKKTEQLGSLQTAPLRESSCSEELQSLFQGHLMPSDSSTRSRSVPLNQMLQNVFDQSTNLQNANINEHDNILRVLRSFSTNVNDNSFQDQSRLDLRPQPEWVPEESPLEDLQATLEDLRDCDSEYSKLALELDQVIQEETFS